MNLGANLEQDNGCLHRALPIKTELCKDLGRHQGSWRDPQGHRPLDSDQSSKEASVARAGELVVMGVGCREEVGMRTGTGPQQGMQQRGACREPMLPTLCLC